MVNLNGGPPMATGLRSVFPKSLTCHGQQLQLWWLGRVATATGEPWARSSSKCRVPVGMLQA